ncbi:hypothetical protein PLESTF_001845900 [Pleodorina starrii]|nr:hypothetical protein PLESTM_001864300 [Pleodorina starrii]GLC76832.1 hypothetical protein PLESTF_001845900 [Pleodorina starrii]
MHSVAHRMAGPRFKLDLLSYDDPATLLQLPVSERPSGGSLLQHASAEVDVVMSQDLQLLEELDKVLTTTDISYVHPINANVAPKPERPCLLAESLVSRNPLLFKYHVADTDIAEAVGAASTPGPRPSSTSMAISAQHTQLEPRETMSVRKGGAEAARGIREERGMASDAPASKKRPRRAARQETYNVLAKDEADAAAAKLSQFLESCIASASSRAPGGGDGEEGEEEEGRSPGRPRRIFDLGVLKDLHGRLLAAQRQGYLRLAPQAQLHSLLLALHNTAEEGRNQLLPETAELKSVSVARVAAALEAVLCALVVYSTPKLPPALYLEELLGCAMELGRYHLQANVLALHDARFKRTYRPGDVEDDGDEPARPAKPPRGRGAAASAAARHTPRWTSLLVGQLEQALALLAQVMGCVRMAAEGLLPLVRMSQQTLTVPSLQTLHYRALGLVVSMFRYYPEQRSTVLDEFIQGTLTYLNAGRHPARHFPLQMSDGTSNIQMATALVMQLVQVTAELPPVDATGPSALEAARLPTFWANRFWREVFKKLPTARAAKADTSCDLKAWVEALVEDLLVALPLPEWPAAACLLRRLILHIKQELKSSDAGVQLVCVELLGLMTRSLFLLAKETATPEVVRTVAAAVESAVAAAGKEAAAAPPSDKRELVQELLLEHLAAEASADAAGAGSAAAVDDSGEGGGGGPATSVWGSARKFLACDMLLAHEKALQQLGEPLDEKQVAEAVVHYRQVYDRQRSSLGTSTSGLPDVDRETAIVLGRWLVSESFLGCSRQTLLKWLADAGGSGRTRQETHAANVRAKAIKLLSGAIEVDVRLLNLPDVQAGIKGALSDDLTSVREAAVEVMGKYISRNADVAAQLYDVLVRAADDTGVNVRKRAIRLLWECCVRCPDFVHRTDALLRIVSHATATEDSLRSLVTKICAEIFFLPHFHLEGDEVSSQVMRGADQRAAQLAELVAVQYLRTGGSANMPFNSASPIVAMIRAIVGEEDKTDCEPARQGAREVADWLLARILELQGEQDAPAQPSTSGPQPTSSGQQPQSSGGGGQQQQQQPGQPARSSELFRCLLALHVMCVADVKLLHRPQDPQRVIRSLAPYIKELPQSATDAASRRKAEQLLAVLAVMCGCMAVLRHIDDGLAAEIVRDLRVIMSRVTHVQVMTMACQCLCALAVLKPSARATVRSEAANYYTWLDNDIQAKVTSLPDRQIRYPRFLYSLGTLCRYGAEILDEAVEGSEHPTCAAALSLVLHFYELMGDNIRAKDMALQALGFIFIAQPQLAVNVRDVGPVLEAALDRSAPATIKARCLASLTELLRSEEDVLLARQAAARREAAAAQQASTLPDEESRALARRNGEGDSSSVSSGLIQMLWDKILALATDTTPAPVPAPTGGQTPPPTPSGTASAHGAVVRKRALELIEVVIRGGIVVPWTAMPALCALATDPERDTAARALAQLRAVVAANSAFVAGQVPGGVAEAYAFHCKLAALERPGNKPAPDKYRTLVEGLSGVWATTFQPDKALKTKFLGALLTALEDAATLAANLAAKSDPHLLSFMTYIIAELPYRKMDELLGVLFRVNQIVSRRSADVLNRFHEMREAARAGAGAGAATQQQQDGPGQASSSAPPSASPLAPARPTPSGASTSSGGGGLALAGVVKASMALSLMLLLKQYLRASYDLTAERIAKYDPKGPQCKVEEKLGAVHNGKLRFNASKLQIDLAARTAPAQALMTHGAAGGGASSAAARAAAGLAAAGVGLSGGGAAVTIADPGVDEVYKVFKQLLKRDEAEYGHGAAGSAAEAEVAVAAVAGSSPPEADLRDVTVNLEEMMAAPDSAAGASKKPPLAGRGRGGGRGRGRAAATSAARETSSGRGRGRPPPSGRAGGSKRGGGAKRKRRGSVDDDDEDDDDEDGGEDYKPRSTRRRLDKAL